MKEKRPHLVIDCRMLEMSGIGTYLQNIIPGLIKSDLFEITCLGYPHFKSYSWSDLVSFIEMKSGILSLAEQLELFQKIPPCDILWSPNWNIPLLPVKAAKRVVTIHDVYHLAHQQEFKFHFLASVKLLLNRAIHTADRILTVSDFSRKEIVKWTNCPEKKITVSKLSVSSDFNKNFEYRKIEDRYVLCVGNVKPHKNLTFALNAFSRLKDHNLKFYIVGKKEGFISGDKNIGQLVEEMGDQVIFTGYVSDAELKNYYANASLFLFPSRYEGFGLPLLEAIKFGIPILSSNAASLPEVGGSVLNYFDPTNEDELVALLEKFNAGMLDFHMDKYEQQLENFSWERTISEHIKCFQGSI